MPANLVLTNHRLVLAVAGLLACLAASPSAAQSVSWPAFGPERSLPRLDGLTDALPDFVGPLDGAGDCCVAGFRLGQSLLWVMCGRRLIDKSFLR
jgi:hypothetical protein